MYQSIKEWKPKTSKQQKRDIAAVTTASVKNTSTCSLVLIARLAGVAGTLPTSIIKRKGKKHLKEKGQMPDIFRMLGQVSAKIENFHVAGMFQDAISSKPSIPIDIYRYCSHANYMTLVQVPKMLSIAFVSIRHYFIIYPEHALMVFLRN